MGYRTYIGVMTKSEYEEIKDLTLRELCKKYDRNYTEDLDEAFTLDFSKITPKQQTVLWEILCHVRNMRSEWKHLNPFDLENGDQVTSSWKYEYSIFELVRLYKTIDWENTVLVYYGY